MARNGGNTLQMWRRRLHLRSLAAGVVAFGGGVVIVPGGFSDLVSPGGTIRSCWLSIAREVYLPPHSGRIEQVFAGKKRRRRISVVGRCSWFQKTGWNSSARLEIVRCAPFRVLGAIMNKRDLEHQKCGGMSAARDGSGRKRKEWLPYLPTCTPPEPSPCHPISKPA